MEWRETDHSERRWRCILGWRGGDVASEPEDGDVHALLRIVLDVLTGYLLACCEAAGELVSDAVPAVEGGYTLCSEVRAVLSREHFEEFEQKYLEELADAVGPLCIHSCGEWARHLPEWARPERGKEE